MTWFNILSAFIKIKNHLNFFLGYICVFEYTYTLHLFPQIYTNLPLYKMKCNSLFLNILPRLYSIIIWKNITIFFQKCEVGYIQTCTPLESNIMWHPKRGHCNVLSPKTTFKKLFFPLTFLNFFFINQGCE